MEFSCWGLECQDDGSRLIIKGRLRDITLHSLGEHEGEPLVAIELADLPAGPTLKILADSYRQLQERVRGETS